MYSLDRTSYCSAVMPASFGAPEDGSFGVGCGFSDSGESPLGVLRVEENVRAVGIERTRGACEEAWRMERRGAVTKVRCLSDWVAARASRENEVLDMAGLNWDWIRDVGLDALCCML
jgi:hypothetical protein